MMTQIPSPPPEELVKQWERSARSSTPYSSMSWLIACSYNINFASLLSPRLNVRALGLIQSQN